MILDQSNSVVFLFTGVGDVVQHVAFGVTRLVTTPPQSLDQDQSKHEEEEEEECPGVVSRTPRITSELSPNSESCESDR